MNKADVMTREWLFKRNCSIAPRQLMLFYVSLCAVSSLVALYFVFRGAWIVLLFSVAEMVAVATAFVICGRHASDRDRILLDDDWLTVELVRGEQARRFRLSPWNTTVVSPFKYRQLVQLKGAGVRVEVGQFLTELKRREFARELASELRRTSSPVRNFN